MPRDIDALCQLGRRFCEESELPLHYDEERSREVLWAVIHSAHSILVVDESRDVLAGIVLGVLQRDFCVETCAYITKFFVEREFRGLGTSRALLSAFDDEAKRRGASIVFASATAGMGDKVEKLYVRLFERAGYQVLGRILMRDL